MSSSRKIFFHVGLAKTGSTYLQNRFFKHLQGVNYQHTRHFKQADEFIAKHPEENVLVSREFDHQFFDEVDRFAEKHPNATPVMLLRRQDKWIASQYRRFAKNGKADKLEEFVDLAADTGCFKKKDLTFFDKIEYLENKFSNPPIVMIFEDFKTNALGFLKDLANQMDSTFDDSAINLDAKHAARTDKALKIIRGINRVIPIRKTEIKWLGPLDLPRQWIMKLLKWEIILFAKIWPKAWVSKEPLIAQEFLDDIKAAYTEDWNKCVAYATKNSTQAP